MERKEPLIILYTRVILTLERVQQLKEKIFRGEQHGYHKASYTKLVYTLNRTVQ